MPESGRYLWRISNHADLRGRGGLRAGARWHSKGREVVYCAEEPTGALLEALVHIEVESLEDLPKSYQLLRIAFPKKAAVEQVALAALPPEWRHRTPLTRSIGDTWLAAARTPALRVPSAISPHAYNVLLNPKTAQAGKDPGRLQESVSVRYAPLQGRRHCPEGANADVLRPGDESRMPISSRPAGSRSRCSSG